MENTLENEEVKNTWTFENKEYPLFLVNQTGNIGYPLVINSVKKGIIVADFAWEEKEPFLDNLDINEREERSARDEEATRMMDSLTAKNVKLFKSIVTSGQQIPINELGEQGTPVDRDKDFMLKLKPEIQSGLIYQWLKNFHIDRFFPEGTDDLTSLLTDEGEDRIFFNCRIGTYENPAHVLQFEFKKPSYDARQNAEQHFNVSNKQENEKVVRNFNMNHNARIQYATKHFVSVKGATLETNGRPFNLDDKFQIKLDTLSADAYMRKCFNPNWWYQLGNKLNGVFDYLGK